MNHSSAIALSYTHPFASKQEQSQSNHGKTLQNDGNDGKVNTVAPNCTYLHISDTHGTIPTTQEIDNAHDGRHDLLYPQGGSGKTEDQRALSGTSYHKGEKTEGTSGSWRIQNQTTGLQRVRGAGNQAPARRKLGDTPKNHFDPSYRAGNLYRDGP